MITKIRQYYHRIACGSEVRFLKQTKMKYMFLNLVILELSEEEQPPPQRTPVTVIHVSRVFKDNKDIWRSNNKPKNKSARSVLPNPKDEDDDSPPLKKQRTK